VILFIGTAGDLILLKKGAGKFDVVPG